MIFNQKKFYRKSPVRTFILTPKFGSDELKFSENRRKVNKRNKKMKSIVIYYSETGNTKKVAKAIAESVAGELKSVEEAIPEELNAYDFIFVGTPVHGSRPAKKISEFLDKLPQFPGKKRAAFCTMHLGGDKITFKIIQDKFNKKGINFTGGFSCLGLSHLVANFGPKKFNKGRPNDEDLKKAALFAKKVCGIEK